MTHPPSARPRYVAGSLVLVLLGGVSSVASAQQSPALDRLDFSFGGFVASTVTTIGASTQHDAFRDRVNLEDDLGLEKHQPVSRARFNFLIGDRQGFSFDYFSVNRAHGQVLKKEFSYGGNNYSAMATVHGKLDFDFGGAAYRWWFGEGNNVFGVGLGGAWYRIKANITGSGTVNGPPTGQESAAVRAHAWAPELQFGWRHAFDDHWRLYADASGVKKPGGRLYGHIYNVSLGIEWYPWKNLGFAAEYDYTKIKLHQRRDTFNDSLDMRMKGPALFTTLRF